MLKNNKMWQLLILGKTEFYRKKHDSVKTCLEVSTFTQICNVTLNINLTKNYGITILGEWQM